MKKKRLGYLVTYFSLSSWYWYTYLALFSLEFVFTVIEWEGVSCFIWRLLSYCLI